MRKGQITIKLRRARMNDECKHGVPHWLEDCKECQKEAESGLPSATGLEGPAAEWTSIEEKLPEESPVLVRYIGQFFGEPDPRIDIGYYDNPEDYENPDDGQGWLFWRNEQPITVTHWMKLPELPKAS